jgi:phosphoglycerate dehydrogenase-like enzyme
MPSTLIAVGPDACPPWFAEAVAAGGAEPVPPARAGDAEALVWADPRGGLDSLLDGPLGAGITWVQLPWAGVERYDPARFRDGRTWTCAKGVYAEPVAEHALALGLAGLRDLPDRVRATRWGRESGRTLYDSNVTILGGGGITESLLALLRPLRAKVTVVRRSPALLDGSARTLGPDQLDEALPDADLVILALALTPATRGIIAGPQLKAMAANAYLVNVARGGHIVTDDLVEALREGWIKGAALDVTDPEPLPDGHPLWDLPNCLITPHTADAGELGRPHLMARITDNVRRFVDGRPLVGLIDPEAGY